VLPDRGVAGETTMRLWEAMEGFRALRHHPGTLFGGQGVTVNNLAPGAVLTARNRAQMATEAEAVVQRIPAGRLGRPDGLVGAALLPCSDAGSYINGANLFVDGGHAAG